MCVCKKLRAGFFLVTQLLSTLCPSRAFGVKNKNQTDPWYTQQTVEQKSPKNNNHKHKKKTMTEED
jgi:hypothetical protein